MRPVGKRSTVGTVERTLAIIKPDAIADAEKIMALIAQAGFFVVRRADVRVSEEQAEKLQSDDDPADSQKTARIVQSFVGDAVVLVLSKCDAVRTWLDMMGPHSPTHARQTQPHSLRALFGTDDIHNALYGSSDVLRAERDCGIFFTPPDKVTKEGVMDALVPLITEAMSELAIARPSDPYMWLAGWIRDHRPPAPRPCVYNEPVLVGNVLKSDRFEGIGKVKCSEVPGMPACGLIVDGGIGYWNFRKARGIAPVFGIGQSTKDGIEACLNHISRVAGYDEIICLNMREEPVVFVNGLPISPREEGHLNDNVSHLVGIDGYELGLMEARLKKDILLRGSPVTLYHQTADMANHEREHHFESDSEIQTPEEVYTEMNEKRLHCRYVRIPITDEAAPEEAAFDSLVEVLRDTYSIHPAFIMNCQMGRGRTTTAMVCVSIFWRMKSRVPSPEMSAIDEGERNLPNGEFSTIMRLLKLLPNGTEVKQLVDACIDDCSAFHNLRTSIFEAKSAGDAAAAAVASGGGNGEEGRDPTFWYARALNYLHRYYYVLLFGAYLLEHTHRGLEKSFSDYLRENWQLKSPIVFSSIE